MERQPLDGGTVLSDDAGLSGPVRPLMWLVVDDAGYGDVLHVLVDLDDKVFGIMLAYQYAGQIMDLTAGTVAATMGDIADARVWQYPTPLEAAELLTEGSVG